MEKLWTIVVYNEPKYVIKGTWSVAEQELEALGIIEAEYVEYDPKVHYNLIGFEDERPEYQRYLVFNQERLVIQLEQQLEKAKQKLKVLKVGL